MTDETTAATPAEEAPPPIPTNADVLAYLDDARVYQKDKARQAAIRWGRKHGIDPGKKPRTLSQWSMGVIRECAHKYMLAQVLKVRTRVSKSSLAFGTAIGRAVTQRLGITGDLESAQTVFLTTWAEEVEKADGMMQTPKDWTLNDFKLAGQALINAMEPTLDKVRPVYVDKWLDWAPIVDPITGNTVDGFVLAGKLDILDLVQLDGMDEPVHCITDTKALVSLMDPADHYLGTRLSLQLVGYAYAATHDELLRELPGIGTLVGYFEGQRKKPPAPPKLKKDGTPSKAKPAAPPRCQRTFADVGPAEFRELMLLASTLAGQVLTYAAREEQGLPLEVAWPRNMSACNRDAYGQPCDYRPLCRAALHGSHPGLDEVFTYEYERRS